MTWNMMTWFELGNTIFEGGLISYFLWILFFSVVIRILTELVRKFFTRWSSTQSTKKTSLQFLGRIIEVILWSMLVFAALLNIKPLRSVATAVLGATSILSVIVGLAAQESFGNFIAGVFIVFFQPFRVGDRVRLMDQNKEGIVQEITFRHTVLRSYENTNLIIPNSTMNRVVIENQQFGQEVYHKYISVHIDYENDIDLAIQTIETILLKEKELVYHESPGRMIKISNLDLYGVELKFSLHTTSYSDSFEVASRIRRKILLAFKEKGIHFSSYPIAMK